MATIAPSEFNKQLLAFLEENDLKDSFMRWMEWNAGSEIVTKIVKDELDEQYALAVESNKVNEYLAEVSRLQLVMVDRLNCSSSKFANNLMELRLRATAAWLSDKMRKQQYGF